MVEIHYQHIEWASCNYYAQHSQMMPDDWKAQLEGCDAILFGAVGWPDKVPDHVSLWGSLLKFRREFDQYINLRPARLFDGVPSPLAGRQPGDIDFMIVREKTQGEYPSVGGTMYEGTEREFVMQQAIFSRHGTERVLKFAFDLAARREKKITVATKSNGISISNKSRPYSTHTGLRNVKVQQIGQAIELGGLEDWGSAALPGHEGVRESGKQYVIAGSEAVDTGVFECSPGTYRRGVKQAEVMHLLSGSGSITPDRESAIHFRGGDTLFFEAKTEGLWQVDETMRKIYVIL